MADQSVTLQDILVQSRALSPQQRVWLIERLAADLGPDVARRSPEHRSLLGLWSDLGSVPSEAVLEAARREAWSTFPSDTVIDQDT